MPIAIRFSGKEFGAIYNKTYQFNVKKCGMWDGSLNILRKAVPNAFSNGIMGVVVHPVMVILN
jgi:hypothetical protein